MPALTAGFGLSLTKVASQDLVRLDVTVDLAALAAAGRLYATTAEGLADTVDGDYFFLAVADADEFPLYLNDGGSAVDQGIGLPSATAVQGALTAAANARAVVSGEVLAMRLEASNLLRVWAGAGSLAREGDTAVAITSPGEQPIDDGYGYFYRLSTDTFSYLSLDTASPAWQTDGDYYLLFGNVGGRLVGAYKDARQVSTFAVEKTATTIDIWTPELRPFSNQCYRLRFIHETAGTRQDVWRWHTAHLAERTTSGYDDIAAAIWTMDKEVVLTETGKGAVGGTNGNHKLIGDMFLFLDGKRIEDATGEWTATTIDIAQHTELLEEGSTDPGTRIAMFSGRHSIRMVDGAPAVLLAADFQTVEPISIESLYIGNTEPYWTVAGGGSFDTVFRGPQWWRNMLDNTALSEFESTDTIIKYEGAGILIDGSATVAGEGATCEVEILPGSDWTDDDRFTLISATNYGQARFHWMGRAFAPATAADTLLRARIQWRFGFNGD